MFTQCYQVSLWIYVHQWSHLIYHGLLRVPIVKMRRPWPSYFDKDTGKTILLHVNCIKALNLSYFEAHFFTISCDVGESWRCQYSQICQNTTKYIDYSCTINTKISTMMTIIVVVATAAVNNLFSLKYGNTRFSTLRHKQIGYHILITKPLKFVSKGTSEYDLSSVLVVILQYINPCMRHQFSVS